MGTSSSKVGTVRHRFETDLIGLVGDVILRVNRGSLSCKCMMLSGVVLFLDCTRGVGGCVRHLLLPLVFGR